MNKTVSFENHVGFCADEIITTRDFCGDEAEVIAEYCAEYNLLKTPEFVSSVIAVANGTWIKAQKAAGVEFKYITKYL